MYVHPHGRPHVMLFMYVCSVEQGECVLVLADRMLLEMPLEALGILQGDGISSVSRDFSLQVFYTRLQREQPGKTIHRQFCLTVFP